MERKAFAKENVFLAGLILVCFCMRSPMSPVGPLVPQIQASLGLSAAFSGLLTTIPLLIFAVVSPLAGRLTQRIADRTLMPACLLLILLGILLRSYAGVAGLIAGTGLLGLGIGILNVCVPVFIRANFAGRIGFTMGVYTASMTLVSALAAGCSEPLSHLLHGWNNALSVWLLLPAAAIPVWLYASKLGFAVRERNESASLAETARSGKSWCIALFMALQSSLFFCMLAWLPSMLIERGVDPARAGVLALVMQLVSLSTNFLMPALMQRFSEKRHLLAILCGVCYAPGFAILLLPTLPVWLQLCSIVLLGLASGMCLSFALTLIVIHGKTQRETAGLSVFVQGLGYLIAAPAPMLLGSLVDLSGNFRLPVVLLTLICVPMAYFGCRACINRRRD